MLWGGCERNFNELARWGKKSAWQSHESQYTHTQTHTHLANPDLSQENRPPAHTVCDTAAVANPVLRLVFFVTLFFAAGPIHLHFYRMNSLTWVPAGLRGSRSAALSRGSVRAPQLRYTDTGSPGSQQRNPSFVPEKQRTVVLVPLALTHREMICRERRRASLSPSAGGRGSRSILRCQLRAAPLRDQIYPGHHRKGLPSQLPAN